MDNVVFILLGLAAVAVVAIVLFQKQVVREYEVGLLYSNGRFARLLTPGAHWLFRPRAEVTRIDKRRQSMVVPSQELISADHVGIKVSLIVSYEVADPVKATHAVADYHAELYSAAQLALRRAASEYKVEDLLGARTHLGEKLLPDVGFAAEALGLKVHAVDCRDIMFPGDLKKTFGDIVRAQKEGQAALERARGETAALRSLSNAARMINDNPGLLHLRTLQAIAGGSGNTVVLGSTGFIPTPKKQDRSSGTEPPANEGDDGDSMS